MSDQMEAGTRPTIYIPTLNGGERLARCLTALEHQTTASDIVIADNSSDGACGSMLRERFPGVYRVGSGSNLGFGRALNRAIAERGDGPIILLNDDAAAEPTFVEHLLARSDQAEMVAGVMLKEDDPSRIDSAGVIVDQTLLGFDHLSGMPVTALADAPDPLGPTGGAALYNRDAFNAVGGFDERIFLYYEDVDLALRMRLRGAHCVLAAHARATHGYSETLGARSAAKYSMTGWSRGYLIRRYGVMCSPALAAQTLGRELVTCAGQLLLDRTTAGFRGRVRGWHAARNLERRETPERAVSPISLREAITLRRRRNSV